MGASANLHFGRGASSYHLDDYGVAAFRDTHESLETILQRVDRNLYQGKRAGRNRVMSNASSA
ncbi:diguanylate cyclase [Billgrantia pellis]|uniref:Diguanylate cyclase n=1 Tax=Billgrantia pellis TaxID=2606936 RepID=A0A7V7FYY0_9GAMM|nr:diguanylate cyclase [Halomonas pellis]